MAFGKKKSQSEELPAGADIEPEEAGGEAIDGSLFAAQAGTPEGGEGDLAGAFTGPEAATAEAAGAEAPAAEVTPEAPAAGGDALSGGPDLLSMFQTTQVQSDDRAALLDLAGEVEIDDLLEELQTVASAMGIRVAE